MKILRMLFSLLGFVLAVPLMSECSYVYEPLCNLMLSPRQNDLFTLQFEGEFLYMKGVTGSLDYLSDGVGISSAAGNPPIEVPATGMLYSPEWKYQPGFRLSAAAYFGRNNAFDTTARYWRFRTHVNGQFLATDHPELAATVQIIGAFFTENNSGRISIHSADISLDLPENIVDLVGGYSFDVTRNLYFRTFAGLSGFWTKVIVQSDYEFFNPITAAPTGEERSHLQSVTNGWGIGPIVGLDCAWSMWKNLSLFASFDFSLRYLEWKMRVIQQEARFTAPGGTFDIVRAKLTSNPIGFGRNFLIGPQLDLWFAKESCHLTLRTAWEWILLDGSHQAFVSAAVSDTYFVTEIQGLNASASLEF